MRPRTPAAFAQKSTSSAAGSPIMNRNKALLDALMGALTTNLACHAFVPHKRVYRGYIGTMEKKMETSIL